VPEIGVGEIFDGGSGGVFLEGRVFCDFLGAFPVVDGKCAVVVFVDHVDGAGDLEILVENGPFRAVGAFGGVVLDELQKVVPFRGFVEGVEWGLLLLLLVLVVQSLVSSSLGDWLVHEAFDFVVEICAGGGDVVGVFFPEILDLLWCETPVFVLWVPVSTGHHFGNDAVGVKGSKMGVVPCCYRSVCCGRVVVDRVFVGWLVKGDAFVAGVRVFLQKGG